MRALAVLALLLAACLDFDALSRCYGGDCGPAVMPCFKTIDHTYRGEVLADLPGIYLRLGETSGPTAKDETGMHAGSYSTSGVGYSAAGALSNDSDTAITLNGNEGNGVTVPASFDFVGTSPFTVELWAKDMGSEGYGFAVDHENWSSSRAGWVLLLGGPNKPGVGFERRDSAGGVSGSVVGGPALDAGVWHHVAVTYDSRALSLYFDGQLKGTNDTTSDIGASGMPWLIGNCIGCGTSNGFVGALDEVAVYDHAVEECRVSAHFSAAR